MDSSVLSGLVAVKGAHPAESPTDELYRPLTAPAKTVPRTYPGAPQRESFDLHRIPVRDGGQSGTSSPRAGNDVEMSRPPSPDAVEVVPDVWQPFMNRFRLVASCLAYLGNGLVDSAAGALIPYMET